MSSIEGASYRYHIAIDFGTHGSGFAYGAAADGEGSVKTFEYWAGQRGQPAPKTRTALLYRLSSLSKPVAWGWEAVTQYADLPEGERSGFVLLESFKLYLMPDDFEGLPPLPPGLTVRKLVGDFLGCLVGLINSTLEAHYGNRYRPSAARWCLTVPAGLPQCSMTTMREAAMDAGIIPTLKSPSLLLATEPEAAALAAQQRKDLFGLSVGGAFMIIDMGGGTVDMTLHKVDSVLEGTSLSEVTHRECLPQGATAVDQRFTSYLYQYLGDEACQEWAGDGANAEDWQDLMYSEWEACKCAFDSTSTARVQVQLLNRNATEARRLALQDEARAKLEADGSADKLLLSPDVMASFFTPSLDRIASRAVQMLSRAGGADVIVLVGGFSSSRYAMRHLRSQLEVAGRPVVTPTYSRSAVLEGGVWYARYPAAITARCSNMTYGIRTATRWQPGAPSKTWIEHKQAYRCLEGFSCYVSKDELVRAGSTITHTFSPLYPNQTRVRFDIYSSLAQKPRWTVEESMVKIASVQVDIPLGSYKDPEFYQLSAHFSFGDAQISVRCVDEQTGQERHTSLLFDSSEAAAEQIAVA